MINAHRHTEKLVIACMVDVIIRGCVQADDDYIKASEDYVKLIRSAEKDPKQANKNLRRALELTRSLTEKHNEESGEKITLAIYLFFEKIIAKGYEILQEGEFGASAVNGILGKVEQDSEYFDKRYKNADKIANQWLEHVNKEGYFL